MLERQGRVAFLTEIPPTAIDSKTALRPAARGALSGASAAPFERSGPGLLKEPRAVKRGHRVDGGLVYWVTFGARVLAGGLPLQETTKTRNLPRG